MQLPVAFETLSTIPTSLLVFWESFTPLHIYLYLIYLYARPHPGLLSYLPGLTNLTRVLRICDEVQTHTHHVHYAHRRTHTHAHTFVHMHAHTHTHTHTMNTCQHVSVIIQLSHVLMGANAHHTPSPPPHTPLCTPYAWQMLNRTYKQVTVAWWQIRAGGCRLAMWHDPSPLPARSPNIGLW